ncbi:MAG: glycosyltransferase family 87 protein [Vicinamibacteraceae bacterium]
MSTSPRTGDRLFTGCVWLTTATLAGIVGFTAATGLVDRMGQGWAGALVAAGLVNSWLSRVPAFWAVIAAASPAARRWFTVGALVLLPQLVLLTIFIVDANASAWRSSVWRPWQSRHSCVSAYWVAAQRVNDVPNLYAETVYRTPIPPTVTRQPNLGPFFVDVFEYPPPFLPLPRLLGLVSPDFWTFRRLWFALNLAGVAVGLVAIARRLDAEAGTHATWLTPFALAAPAVVGTLQVGNVQLLFIVMSAVAMLLFERRQHAAGGVLLGYAVASKLFPGVLLLFLVLRRDWRAIGWTVAAGAALTLISFIDVGWTPFAAFLEHLPKLLSGEAFPGLFRPDPIAINESVPGLVFKLGLFGVPDMGFAAAKIVGWAYTLVVVGATAWMALGVRDRSRDPLLWVAILLLATLRSPFLPSYAVFPPLWLATLVAAVCWHRPGIRWFAIALGLLLAFSPGQGAVPPQLNAILTFGHTVAGLVLVGLALRPVSTAEVVARPSNAQGLTVPA